jgi:hypothetical protein
MDVKTAAIQVLKQAGTALHAKNIAEQIMAAGLWQSDGKTPDATVSARLLLRRQEQRRQVTLCIGVHRSTPALKERISTQIQVTPQTGGRSQISGPGCGRLGATERAVEAG